MKRWQVGFLVVATVLSGGSFAGHARRDYLRAYHGWTQELDVYWDFQTALIVRATYFSADMRKAMADERLRLTGETDAEHAKFMAVDADDAKAYDEFVLTATTDMAAADKFGPGDGDWHLRLDADGTAEDLVTVYKVRDPSSLQRALFPMFNNWSTMWIARFAHTVESPHQLVIHVGSGYGHGDMKWKVD